MPRSEGLARGTAGTDEGAAGGMLLEEVTPLEFTTIEFGLHGRFGCTIDRKPEESGSLDAFGESHESVPFSGGIPRIRLYRKNALITRVFYRPPFRSVLIASSSPSPSTRPTGNSSRLLLITRREDPVSFVTTTIVGF